jgi:hypothetical protein
MGLIFILFIDIDAMGGPKFKKKKKAYPADYEESSPTLFNINMSTCNHSHQVQGKSEPEATILTNGPWMDGWMDDGWKRETFAIGL